MSDIVFGIRPVAEKVLQGEDDPCGTASHQSAKDALYRVPRLAQIQPCRLAHLFLQFKPEAQKGIVIVGTGIGNQIFGVIVRQMRGEGIAVEAELEYRHTRIPCVREQIAGLLINGSQILRQ